jgi:hypothetical protein
MEIEKLLRQGRVSKHPGVQANNVAYQAMA